MVWDQEKLVLLNLINQQPDINKNFLLVKGPCESKFQLLINKKQKNRDTTFKKFGKAFVYYSQTIDDVYENLEDYNTTN